MSDPRPAVTARAALITRVWNWDRIAVTRNMAPAARRGIWRILDALYDDMAMVRTPGFRATVTAALDGLKQSEEVLAVRKELEL